MFTSTLSRGIIIGSIYTLLTACSGATEPFPTPGSELISGSVSGVSTGTENNGSTGTGVVTLSWMPPTENSDDSVLTDLAGYKIYYGESENGFTGSIIVNNPGLSSYVIENLKNNTTYSFVITSINSDNVESGYSNIARKFVTS